MRGDWVPHCSHAQHAQKGIATTRILVVLAIILVAVSACAAGGTGKHALDGSVLIFHQENFVSTGSACEGTGPLFDLVHDSPVRITPFGKDPVWTKLSMGALTDEGNCRLKFTADIPEADMYLIEVGGRIAVQRSRALIERPDGWWVTLDWDGTSVVPNP